MAKLAADLDGSLMDRLASKGRYGDTMVAHINPQEAQMLMKEGGSGTINPMTGLPEFYDSWSDSDDTGDGFGGFADAMGDAGMSYSDEGIGYDEPASSEGSGPEVDWAAGWGEFDPGGPTKGQAEKAEQDFQIWSKVIEVARDHDYNIRDQDFLQRLENQIQGRTQNAAGENIGLTRGEISELGHYDPNLAYRDKGGSYLGYNDFVDLNAFQTIDEDNTRQDIAYTDSLNVKFKENGLDAKIEPDPQNPGNYVYSGPDAAAAMFGEITGAIGNLVGGYVSMMSDAFQMTPAGVLTGMAFGRDLAGPKFFDNETVPGPGKYLGQKLGLVDEENKAPLADLYDSVTNSIKSTLGIGTNKPADKISVNKSGEITSASREGKDINVSGVPSAEQTIDNILNTGLPTDEEFLNMTSGDIKPSEDLNINMSGAGMPGPSKGAYTMSGDEETGGSLDAAMNFGTATSPDYTKGYDPGYDPSLDWAARTAPDYEALADARRDDYLSTLDLNTASTLVDPAATATAFANQPDPYEYGGNEPIVRRKPRPVVSQAIDEAVTKEEKPSFPTTPLPRLTEGGLKTLQYVYRNDPETLQNIYNKYALPEQYSGLKALV